MTSFPHNQPIMAARLAWLIAAVGGVAAPALAMVLLADAGAPMVTGSIIAVGLMAAGMIGAAAAGRLPVGIAAALASGAGLVTLMFVLGISATPRLPAILAAIAIASLSFAARGALFARSSGDKGWWIAVAVVGGEAAMLAVAAASPGAVPSWLLALLPARWASTAIAAALAGAGAAGAVWELAALGATAAATLLVARLWPRRWPYLVMFTTWIGASALVWHHMPA